MDLLDVTTLIGFAGGLAVLVSFAGVALGRLAAHSVTYHAMNLAGGLALLAAGVAADAWPSVAVNGTWALISAHGLARAGVTGAGVRAGAPMSIGHSRRHTG
jgi:hypothetical protein